MEDIYVSGSYRDLNESWHIEDSKWKANEIQSLLNKSTIVPEKIVEIGCGVGGILESLALMPTYANSSFAGYDVSEIAIEICKKDRIKTIDFFCEDLLLDQKLEPFDLLLAIDVFEHVPDYMGFLSKCSQMSKYQMYHIPLDLHVSSVARGSFLRGRNSVGHLHYFSSESALATLADTGHKVIDHAFTSGATDLFFVHPSMRKAIANIPRGVLSRVSKKYAARLFGGYSLLVLCEKG